MRPAESEQYLAGFGEYAIASIAIDLQRAAEAFEMSGGTLRLAIGCVDVSDSRRRRSAPRPIIPGVGPELAGLGTTAAWIEHWRRRLIGKELGRAAQLVEQLLMERPEPPRAAADPIGQG